MEYINQVIENIKNSPNPEIYYFAVAAALIFVFYMVDKILRVVTLVVMAVVLAFGFSAMQGNDVSGTITAIKETTAKIFSSLQGNSGNSNASSSGNGSYITGTAKPSKSDTNPNPSSSSSSSSSNFFDVFSKFKGSGN